MKKIFLLSLFLVTIAAPNFAFGETKSVTLDWLMSDATNVTNYRLYYSSNSDMSGKIMACEANDSNVTTLTCNNVNIDAYPAYFTIAAVTPAGEVNSAVVSVASPPGITPVQGFTVINTH